MRIFGNVAGFILQVGSLVLDRSGISLTAGILTARSLVRKAAFFAAITAAPAWAVPDLFPAEFVYGNPNGTASFLSSVASVCESLAQNWRENGFPEATCASINYATEQYVIAHRFGETTLPALRYYFCPDDIAVGPTRELMCQSLGVQIIDPMKNLGPLCGVDTPNPINSKTGNKYQIETDYSSPAGLMFRRVYNQKTSRLLYRSKRTAQTPDAPPGPSGITTFASVMAGLVDIKSAATMTAHWRHNFQRSVTLTSNGTASSATLTRPDGKAYMYALQNGLWKSDADVTGKLSRLVNANGLPIGWEHLNSEDETEKYNDSGTLLSITTRAGLTQTLAYDIQNRLSQVVDPFGRTLTLTYDAQNRLQTLTDPNGGLYGYGYDAKNNLTSTSYPDGKVHTYLYENIALPHALTGILDENGSRFATYTYDGQGRGISSENAGGVEKVSLVYNVDGTTTVTDALGTARTYGFQTILGVVKSAGVTQPCASCGGGNAATTYDANGNPASKTDFNGSVTTYVYDLTRNLETSRTEAAGTPLARTLTTAWHPTFRLPTQIYEPNRVTSLTYDAQGNVTQKTITAGTLNRTWSYTYNPLGLVTSVNGPRTDVADVSTYTYDTQGNLATVSNALGHITRLTAHDAHGRPLTIQDPNGLITQLRYDARGRLITRFVGNELTQFQYDGVGQLTRIILPDSSFMDYSYDAAHRLIALADALGNKISYTLDALGNRIKEDILDPSNTLTQQRRRVFDSLNHLAQDIGAQNQITSYQYDANGNLLSRTDPLARTTAQAYDALNRLVQVTDPANGIAKYTYDANDRLTQVMDPRTIGTAYSYDGLDNLTQTLSLDAGPSTNTHDAAGNILTRTDARGKKTTYTYDALNRLIKTLFADATSVTYQYDAGINALGRLIKMTDSADITQWTYDPQGRVITQTQTTGTLIQVLRYGYDASGRVAQLTYPSGKVISYGYDLAGNLAHLSLNGQPLLNTIRYQPYGAVKAWTWSNGTPHTRTFNLDGRLISHPQGNAPLSISYDSAGRIVQQTQIMGVQSYGYDAVDRLTQHVDSTGLVSNYQYDANGNRTQLTQGSIATAYNLSITSNRLNSQSGPVNKSYSYDVAGNLIGDGTHAYTYDARGRLAKVVYGTRSNNTFVLNGLGQRIRKTGTGVSTGTNRYVYDAQGRASAVGGRMPGAADVQGHLLGDYTSTGVVIQETVYLGDTPVAVLTPTATYFIHADHLDTPRVITDNTNKVIWRWDSDSFGTTLANEDPDGDRKKFTYNLRFPGQYFDKETGLHYNYFRDYNPRTGRYIQSDPIGLEGGMNLFTYVNGNPISFTDSYGLWRWPGNISDEAARDAQTKFPRSSLHNGSGDAYRHCLASCMVSRENSAAEASMLGWLNEKRGDYTHNQERGERAMDENNNAKGRACGKTATSTQDCANKCLAANLTKLYEGGSTKGYWK